MISKRHVAGNLYCTRLTNIQNYKHYIGPGDLFNSLHPATASDKLKVSERKYFNIEIDRFRPDERPNQLAELETQSI